jgi:RNA-directed DNA polymerase
VDGQSCEQYRKRAPERLMRLQEQIKNGSYSPPPVKRVWIPKLGSKELRPAGIPTVEDRVVQTAVRNVIEPIFENIFAEHSYGFRPGRGAEDALRRVDHLLKAGKGWVADADLKGYFDTIPQDILLAAVAEHISDGALLDLLGKMLRQGVMETGKDWQPSETGTPQGAVVSPLLAPPGPASDAGGCERCESDFKRLVRIFSSQRQERVYEARPVCTAASANDLKYFEPFRPGSRIEA